MTSSPPTLAGQRRLRCPASQVIASTSRWLVGSSSSSTSHSPASSAASATRRRWPPLSTVNGASQGMSASSPRITSRTRASPAQTCSGVSPTTACSTVSSSSSVSPWSSTPTRTPPLTVTRPASGRSRPASISSRLVLPSPFLPTTPTRSPSFRPRVTLPKTTFVGNSRCRASAPRRCAMSLSRLGHFVSTVCRALRGAWGCPRAHVGTGQLKPIVRPRTRADDTPGAPLALGTRVTTRGWSSI